MNVNAASTAGGFRPNLIRRLYEWTVGWADRPGGSRALFCIAFIESSFFPIPPDVLLLALCVGSPKKSFRFALSCSVGSVLGGMFGYLIGFAAWQAVRGLFIPFVFSQELFDKVQVLYQGNAFLALLAAAFTPIPYRVFTVAAGVFNVDFWTLASASVLGRSARFFAVGGVLYFLDHRSKCWWKSTSIGVSRRFSRSASEDLLPSNT